MGIFDPDEVITEYTLREAIEDGVLVEIFKNDWGASMNVFEMEGAERLLEIWNRFVLWQRHVCPKLLENERFFSTEIDCRVVWVIDDRVCFTILYPEDY